MTRSALFAVLLIAANGCGRNGFSPSQDVGNTEMTVKPAPTPGEQNSELAICTDLSLKEVSWPSALDYTNKRSLALALNISGSFEGSQGWKNITNNFDGQGLSLGLLNQCLGQGSLQPLLLKMRDRNSSVMKEHYSSAHIASLLGMMSKYETTAGVKAVSLADEGQGDEDLKSDGRLSLLDSLPDGSEGRGQQESASSDSVVWAKTTLYTDGGTTFQSTWKKELQTMSAAPTFVSIQIEAAMTLHTKAIAYMKTLGLKELRSYLFLFDINVQNGGLYSADITAFKAAISASATEDQRLSKILALRLTHVIAKYKADVQARKQSIINGKGVVHGSNRDYATQYCFSPRDSILQ